MKDFPLFTLYPQLEARLPRVTLATLPTPVERLDRIGMEIGVPELFIKRDDLSGAVYGGNKVRKLEFLLGNILHKNAREVITLGFVGSNHALATAIYAKQLGLKSVSMLMPQVNAHYVRRNLLTSWYFDAHLTSCKNLPHLCLGIIGRLCRGIVQHGTLPRLIPAGGSCPLGVVGYVNAAYELRDQIIAGVLPEPDIIYVPLGSMGTAAGLMLGLRTIGLKSQVVPVRVIEERMASPKRMPQLIRETATLLHRYAPAFPGAEFALGDLEIRNDCLGEGYARFTEKAVNGADLMRRKTGIILNGAYSAKAFSALLDDAGKGILNGKTVLFWNTYNSRDLTQMAQSVDFRRLPRDFHRYFEEDVQPLDIKGVDR